MQRVIVCGGRTYANGKAVREVIAALHGQTCVVTGGARGADHLAHSFAKERGLWTDVYPANWTAPCRESCSPGHRRTNRQGIDYCPAAGNYRNEEMLASLPDLVIAFPGGSGTADMVKRAVDAGVPTLVYTERSA